MVAGGTAADYRHGMDRTTRLGLTALAITVAAVAGIVAVVFGVTGRSALLQTVANQDGPSYSTEIKPSVAREGSTWKPHDLFAFLYGKGIVTASQNVNVNYAAIGIVLIRNVPGELAMTVNVIFVPDAEHGPMEGYSRWGRFYFAPTDESCRPLFDRILAALP